MQKRCTVDLWTAGCAGSRLTAPARSPMDKPWTTLCVAHRLPTGRRLPTSSTALDSIRIKSGKVKTNTPAPALAYSPPVTVQTSGTTATVFPEFSVVSALFNKTLVHGWDELCAANKKLFFEGVEFSQPFAVEKTCELEKLLPDQSLIVPKKIIRKRVGQIFNKLGL